ncbi:hypothetical protein JAAARDRAFT_436641 [Jaapia argillacea MUCL 33604]|uniref:DUF6593 domain-containing protein n=1 Tax=Jaapia argillacea MUCL 33604 TaxID=933084 RepID=A0A067PEF6_9AGAM|nr:hypothetical protein JAAARDRAFT_436641 [Jaapia argillacea MUCL 33604]
MKLILTKGDPKHTTLLDDEGREAYKITTLKKFARPDATTIGRRNAPHPLPSEAATSTQPQQEDSEEQDEEFSEIARIYWRRVNPTELIFKGQKIILKEVMASIGFLNRDRQFIGPNGVAYIWKIPSRGHLELYVDDESKTEVAALHGASKGVRNQKHPAFLEIQPAGLHMVDLIVVTMVYVEYIRVSRERANRYDPTAHAMYKWLMS